MTVETVTYISDLNSTLPAGADAPSEGDNHIRNIKAGLKATFPNINGAVNTTDEELNKLAGNAVLATDLTKLAAVTATAAELNYVDVTAAGTAQASKALVLDVNKNASGLGNIAIGGTARAWSAVTKVVDVGESSAVGEDGIGTLSITANARFDGTSWRYIADGFAGIVAMRRVSGVLDTFTAPSGLAGAVITFTLRHSIANNGTTKINDNTARHDGNIFHGRVNSAGTALRLPAWWTSTLVSAGDYSITHNLNTTALTITATVSLFSDITILVYADTVNTFRVNTRTLAGALSSRDFNFMLMLD